ncbi:MAG: hypothetical protein HQ567_11660 [Candidatus Nealsonbacteria bacterium]|nr:hypothetical protein [Candidatus Nealsonbacteria bacterium]
MFRLTVFSAVLVLAVGVEQVQGAWTVTQLTNSPGNSAPQVSGSNVVWQAFDNGWQSEIFLYDGTDVTQLTDNIYGDRYPQVSGSNVVWRGGDGNDDSEIFLYDGSTATTKQLTDNGYPDDQPQISGSNVVWQGGSGGDAEIFFYDGSTTKQLTNTSHHHSNPQISGSNVVWSCVEGYFFYDGSTTKRLNYSDAGTHPEVSGSNVVWNGRLNSGADYEIFLYDGTDITQLTDNNYEDGSVQVSGSNVVWNGYPNSGTNSEIFLYDGATTKQLTNNNYHDGQPQISGSNVVWQGGDSGEEEIFFYDGTGITQLTNNGRNFDPQVSGSNVVWEGRATGNREIFMATLSPSLTWDNQGGDGDSNWATVANWNPNQLPDEFNETTIANGDTVLLDSPAQKAWSVSLENGTLHVAAGGELSVTEGITVAADCTLTGGGVVTTSTPIVVEWGGVISPGDGVGTLSASSVELQPGSALSAELGGPGLGDRLDLTGELNLAARGDTLPLTWIPGGDSSSKFGGEYVVASYESLSGEFETVGGGDGEYSIGEAYVAGIDYETGSQITVSLHPLLDGDADLDGDVDFGDYMVLEAWFGGPGDWAKGDFDLDGDIDFGDYMILEAAFGDTVPAAATPVPEPGTLVMLLGGVAGIGVGLADTACDGSNLATDDSCRRGHRSGRRVVHR